MLWWASRCADAAAGSSKERLLEPPRSPWYRRFWVAFLAANLAFASLLIAAVVALWPRAAPRPDNPVTTVAVEPQAEQVRPEEVEPTTTLSVSTTARLEPAVLWQRRGSDSEVGELFTAPGHWRINWSFSCRSFAAYGGGNFKLSGTGSFTRVSVQRFAVRGSGSSSMTGGGRGRLIVESVCDHWVIKAVAA
jgi:hypothetical protein